MRCYLLIAMAFLLSGCHRSYFTCRSEYLHPSYLASVQVDTPDPASACFYGQQIIVSWQLPKNRFNKPLTLALHVRYGNREMETFFTPIERLRGWWIYRLLNEDYWCKGGILAFQAELLCEGEVIEEWTHYLWAEIIKIPEN